MPSPIEPTLFDFVEVFAGEVEAGGITGAGTVDESSAIIEFCESFFDQFFANVLHIQILGFGATSKNLASRAAVERRDAAALKSVRSLIALFERFCDLHGEVLGGDYGSAKITYRKFHADYMRKLLERAERWAGETDEPLAVRIRAAREHYDRAMRSQGW
jgi:hypothetical protein